MMFKANKIWIAEHPNNKEIREVLFKELDEYSTYLDDGNSVECVDCVLIPVET